jgi:hypothetical protein
MKIREVFTLWIKGMEDMNFPQLATTWHIMRRRKCGGQSSKSFLIQYKKTSLDERSLAIRL